MIDVTMQDLRFEGAAWRGTLTVDDIPICVLAGTPVTEPVILSWAAGCGPDDLVALTEHDPLLETKAASLAATALARHLVEEDLSKAVLIVSGGTLLKVEVPEGGDMEGALTFARSRHPEAVVLNDMDVGEAVDRLAALG